MALSISHTPQSHQALRHTILASGGVLIKLIAHTKELGWGRLELALCDTVSDYSNPKLTNSLENSKGGVLTLSTTYSIKKIKHTQLKSIGIK